MISKVTAGLMDFNLPALDTTDARVTRHLPVDRYSTPSSKFIFQDKVQRQYVLIYGEVKRK